MFTVVSWQVIPVWCELTLIVTVLELMSLKKRRFSREVM
jgi:hypothetical protein